MASPEDSLSLSLIEKRGRLVRFFLAFHQYLTKTF